MKKILKAALFLCALSSLAYAEETTPVVAEANTTMSAEEQKDAMDILERMRAKIEKEEAEVAGYYEIMGEEKARPSIMDEQKTEATEQASPAEVPQEAAPTEATVEQTK